MASAPPRPRGAASDGRRGALTRPQLLTSDEYIADATHRIHGARRRVLLTTLTIADDHRTDELIDALVWAARRGVRVCVAADVFTYADAAGTFLPTGYRNARWRASSMLASKLAREGVAFSWLGREKGLIWRGRTHTKFCVVDDVAYAFGGVNLDRKGVENADFMLRIDDPRLADDLDDVYGRIQRMNLSERGHRSLELRYGTDRVLVDGGIPGDSIIYRRALHHALSAQRVLLMSQYCPTGELGRAIREREHELWFNPPRNARAANRVLIASSMLWTGHRTEYERRQYLHAKALVFFRPSGARVAITGSHNFVLGGVRLGTREIALETRDPATIEQILRFHDAHVRGTGGEAPRS
ncbi:phospholipase D-like domain-containing protein [Demequina capsici]|uniref:Phospholipase D-like domain-containing protein n=1 Tax=Demequina capsici TaxID=3075620 RepID=A0AA96FE86_9MICO|nr:MULTISPECIES: phospholipase D-like domain-containing protein [unclassified Demequina]WNM24153.1 phospholipase D-like domain-containing protein [Demequina sp. OYTSA14]WNM26981.1 phospholipase D-like domain-containing protein [Demequina sp. PMTSA13]